MLPQPNRLKKSKDIQKIFERGRSFKEDFLILKILPNNSVKTRFGFIVSQKISKKATLRNKTKRKLRELVGLKFKKTKKGIDVIVIAVPGLETKDFWEIDEAMNRVFKKAGILKR